LDLTERNTNIKFIKGVGPAKAALLAKLGIFTLGDLLEHYPRRYEDRSQLKPIRALADGELQTFQALVGAVNDSRPRRGLTLTKITVRDSTGAAQLVWFNQPYVKKWFRPGMELIISGKVERRYGQVQVPHPEIEVIDGADLLQHGRIVPIYPASESVGQRWLRTLIRQALDAEDGRSEFLPPAVLGQYKLMGRGAALENIHFPADGAALEAARRRLVFEELYLLQCGLLYLKSKNKQTGTGVKHGPDDALVRRRRRALPFALTRNSGRRWRDSRRYGGARPMRACAGRRGLSKRTGGDRLAKTVAGGYQGAMWRRRRFWPKQHAIRFPAAGAARHRTRGPTGSLRNVSREAWPVADGWGTWLSAPTRSYRLRTCFPASGWW
jgi:ATP-dependent DNA helicase RecG